MRHRSMRCRNRWTWQSHAFGNQLSAADRPQPSSMPPSNAARHLHQKRQLFQLHRQIHRHQAHVSRQP